MVVADHFESCSPVILMHLSNDSSSCFCGLNWCKARHPVSSLLKSSVGTDSGPLFFSSTHWVWEELWPNTGSVIKIRLHLISGSQTAPAAGAWMSRGERNIIYVGKINKLADWYRPDLYFSEIQLESFYISGFFLMLDEVLREVCRRSRVCFSPCLQLNDLFSFLFLSSSLPLCWAGLAPGNVRRKNGFNPWELCRLPLTNW